MDILAFLLFLAVLLMFVIASIILIYHFVKYKFEGDRHRFILGLFIVVTTVFVVFEFILFFSIDWSGTWQLFLNSMGGGSAAKQHQDLPQILK